MRRLLALVLLVGTAHAQGVTVDDPTPLPLPVDTRVCTNPNPLACNDRAFWTPWQVKIEDAHSALRRLRDLPLATGAADGWLTAEKVIPTTGAAECLQWDGTGFAKLSVTAEARIVALEAAVAALSGGTSAQVAPTCSAMSPTSGPVASQITISGAKLAATTAVTVNGVAATFQIQSDAQVVATVPGGATTGPVVVANATGTASCGVYTIVAGTPAAPTALVATASSASAIGLTWVAPAGSVTGYKIERASDAAGVPGVYAQIASQAGTSYSDTGLAASTRYWYRVRAYNGTGDSPYAAAASATTSAAPAAPVVSNVLVSVEPTQAQVSWNVSPFATGQVLFGASAALGQSSTLETSHLGFHRQVITGLAPATTYHYAITGTSQAGVAVRHPATGTLTFTTAAASSGALLASCSALVSDEAPRSRGALGMPGYLGSVTDPVFGTKITRISADNNTLLPASMSLPAGYKWQSDPFIPGMTVHYPKQAVWNADQTLLLLEDGNCADSGGNIQGKLFLDGETYAPLYCRAKSANEWRWDPSNADRLIYVSNSAVGWYYPRTNTWTPRVALSGYTTPRFGPWEGNPSNDGSKIVVEANDKAVLFVVDLVNQTKSPNKAVSDLYDSLDWASITPDGTKIVVSKNWDNNRIYTTSDNWATWTAGDNLGALGNGNLDHYDFCQDTSDAWVAFGESNGRKVVPLTSPLTTEYTMRSSSSSTERHTSCRNWSAPGWGFSQFKGGTFDGEILAEEIESPAGRIRRLAHHRASGANYERHGFHVPSPDGKRVAFRSDWGNTSGLNHAFVVDMRPLCGG